MYVAQTYSSFVPYLKSIYLTLNSWRSDRDNEGPQESNQSILCCLDSKIGGRILLASERLFKHNESSNDDNEEQVVIEITRYI